MGVGRHYRFIITPMTKSPGSLPVPVPDLDWHREIVKGALETIIIIDLNCNILFHNDHAEGLDPSSLTGKSIFEFFLPEFHELVREKINNVIQTGEMETYELASTYNQNEMRWFMTRVGSIIRAGRVVALSLFIRNTTELKQVEQALSRLNGELEQRVEERTQALYEYAYRLEVSEKFNVALRKAENWQEVFQLLAGHSLSVLEANLAGVYEIKEDLLYLAISLQHSELPPNCLSQEQDPFLYRLLHSDRLQYVRLGVDAELGCEFCGFVHSQQMHALLIAPLRTSDTVVGVMYLGWRLPRSYSTGDEQLLNAFVEAGSNTLHRIWVTQQLEQHIQQREHELHVLYEVMSIASEVLDSEALLKKSLHTTLAAVNCCTGVIHMVDPTDQKLKVAVRENCPEALYTWLQLSGLAQDLWEQVYRVVQVVQVRRLQTQSYHETSGPGVTILSYLGVPICNRKTTVGILSLFSENESLLESGVKQMVGIIADQIGLVLETASQRQHDNETLIIEERQRLARELHDSVSQSLYGLVLSADVCNKLLQLKAYPKLAETLVNIGDVAHQSLKEMRLMLFELRPLSLEAVGLVGALDLRLNTVERHANMETALQVQGGDFIPARSELELYRIATEALNNSLKHARASAVTVALSVSAEKLELVIADNGKGFDWTKKRSGGIGLSSMQERANRMGGTLTIETDLNSGTRVHLMIPKAYAEKSSGQAAL